MSLLQVDFYSQNLAKITNFNIILPNDIIPQMIGGNENYKRNMKTLFLLHGFSGSSKDWLLGSLIQEMAIKYNLAVIMPSGDNSFYLDGKGKGKAYCRYIGEELIEFTRNTFNLSNLKEDTYVGGLSMGGFGAIHTGLVYPETFGKIIALSSALIINNIKNITEDFQDLVADYDYYLSTFGDLDKLDNSLNNPEYLIRKLKEEEKKIPSIYMACGTEDFLLQENRDFHQYLVHENVEVQYQENAGVHDWSFWNQHLEPSIQWLLDT